MSYNIFLDVDGVLCDFVRYSCEVLDTSVNYDNWPNGIWDMSKVFKMSPKEFWGTMNNSEIWENLHKTPDADEIIKCFESFIETNNLCLLTSHSNMENVAKGKVIWLKNNFPNLPYLMGENKEFCVQDTNILVDDRDENIEKWISFGGKGILVPRPWNKLYKQKYETVEYIKKKLKGIIDKRLF